MSEPAVVYEQKGAPSDLMPQLLYSPAEMVRRLQELQEFVDQVMQEEVHYGPAFPGSKKLVLYKAGGEMLAEIYGYRVEPTITARIEIWSPTIPPGAASAAGAGFTALPEKGPFFHYEFEALVYSKRTGALVGKGVGSCNSMENRYRWRQGQRSCPACGVEGAIIKGRADYGGGWLCFAKKGGCGAKFKGDDAKQIEGQEAGRVENDDIATLVNTILKVAKKRACLDAIISVTQSSGLFEADDDGEEESGSSGTRDSGGKEKAGTATASSGRKSFQWRGETIETAGVNATQLLKIEKIMKDFNTAHGAEATLVALKALTGAETMFDLTEDLANVVINQGLLTPADTEKAGTGGGAAATTGAQQELGQAKGKENPYA